MIFRKRKPYRQPDIDVSKKSGSLAFYITIPLTLIVIFSSIVTLVSLVRLGIYRPRVWLCFTYGFVFCFAIFAGSNLRTLKTYIHELKHAAVVILSGNRLTELKVYKDIGHVSYQMYQDGVRFIPFIILAPYYFPLLSLPVLIAALVLETKYSLLLAGLLGASLAIDMVTNYQEIHPHQSDLKRIFGGTGPTYAFIATMNGMWILLCLTWLLGGTAAYMYTGYYLLRSSQRIVEGIYVSYRTIRNFLYAD